MSYELDDTDPLGGSLIPKHTARFADGQGGAADDVGDDHGDHALGSSMSKVGGASSGGHGPGGGSGHHAQQQQRREPRPPGERVAVAELNFQEEGKKLQVKKWISKVALKKWPWTPPWATWATPKPKKNCPYKKLNWWTKMKPSMRWLMRLPAA